MSRNDVILSQSQFLAPLQYHFWLPVVKSTIAPLEKIFPTPMNETLVSQEMTQRLRKF